MIKIENLKHYYTDSDGNEVKALDGVDLTICGHHWCQRQWQVHAGTAFKLLTSTNRWTRRGWRLRYYGRKKHVGYSPTGGHGFPKPR